MPEIDGASGGLVVRPVRLSDRDTLLAWRNDPTAYCWYLVAAPVTQEAHDAWLSGRLARENPTLWIADLEGDPAGSVRLDLDDDAGASVSIVVAAGHRGQGVGAALLAGVAREAAALAVTEITAVVHAGNASSRALFERASYQIQPDGGPVFVTYRLRIPPPTRP